MFPKVSKHLPVTISKMRKDLSKLAVMIFVLSGLNSAEKIECSLSKKLYKNSYVLASHRNISLKLTVIKYCPFGLY